MDKEIALIVQKIKQKQPEVSTDIVEKAFDFIKRETIKLPPAKRKHIRNKALKLAESHSLRPIQPGLIATFTLHTLTAEHPDILDKVNRAFPLYINKMLRACQLAHDHLNKHIHDRDVLKHTINTTLLVAELKLGHKTICASFLKHVPECSPIGLEDIHAEFGKEVHDIIVNIQKLRNISTPPRQKDLKTVRHMFLAVSKELRAIILKMCSLIDWLKNVDDLPPEEQKKRAVEAMEIYAPIADMLGMWGLKWQLEDYAFKILVPQEYQKIEKRFHIDEKKNRDKYIERTRRILLKEAKKAGIDCEISGRLKHFYSIYQKMQNKRKAFNEIYDVFALTVVVDTIDDCYRMLGIIHSLWKPKPRRIKDYIANPKKNNYQSLHTTVYGFNNRMTEFQVRTQEMHDEANYGVAAHWFYKNSNQYEQTPAWIKRLLKEHQAAKSDQEFLESVNTDVLIDRIFVYTPKGDVVALPKGATPVDFAYHIHTDVGHKCQDVIINGQKSVLHRELQNEDVVEIIVDNKREKPDEAWLAFVKSGLARRAIETHLASTNSNHP